MNTKQRRILVAAAIIVVGMLLYAPFNLIGRLDPAYAHARFVYGWLFAPPYDAHVNVELLLTQWFAVGIVSGIAWVLCADKPRE